MAKINEGRILRRSREKTARENTDLLLAKIGKMGTVGIVDIIQDNFAALENFITAKKIDLDLDIALDLLRDSKNPEAVTNTREALRPVLSRFIKSEGYQNLAVHNLGLKFQDAEKVGARNVDRRQREANNREEDIGKVTSGLLYATAALTKTSSVTLSFGLSSLKVLGMAAKGVGNIMEGTGNLLFGRITWKSVAIAAIAGIGIYGASPADVAAEYPALLNSTAKNAFRDACLENPEAMSNRLNAAYAIAMYPDKKDSTARYVYEGSWAAARHGVPPQIIAEFAEFESFNGRQVLNTISSASNPLQYLNEAKLLYSKAYGKKTFRYMEAADRIKNGNASPDDRTFTTSVNVVARMSHQDIRHAVKNPTKITAPVLAAMRIVDDHAYGSELFSLHFLASVPKETLAKIPTMSPMELHLLVNKVFYTKEHNLGDPTTNAIQRVVDYNNKNGTNYALTDPTVAKIVGPVWAGKFEEIVRSNPALMEKGLSANLVFDRMGDKFSHRVKPVTLKIQDVFDQAGSVTELCIDPAKATTMADIPTTMPRYEAAYHRYALAWGFNTLKSEPPVAQQERPREVLLPTGERIPIPERAPRA